MIFRLIAVLITVLAAYWYGLSQTWEAFFTTAGFFLVYLGAETYGLFYNERRVAADRELFLKLREELPFEPSIRFLRDHDLRVSFLSSRLVELDGFVQNWIDESHKFHDKRLERAKKSLRIIAGKFLSDVATNAFSVGESDFLHIPQQWMSNQPECYEQVSDRLNNEADEVVRKHQELFGLARRKLDL